MLDKSHAHGSGICSSSRVGKAHLRRHIARLIDDRERAEEVRTDKGAAP